MEASPIGLAWAGAQGTWFEAGQSWVFCTFQAVQREEAERRGSRTKPEERAGEQWPRGRGRSGTGHALDERGRWGRQRGPRVRGAMGAVGSEKTGAGRDPQAQERADLCGEGASTDKLESGVKVGGPPRCLGRESNLRWE